MGSIVWITPGIRPIASHWIFENNYLNSILIVMSGVWRVLLVPYNCCMVK